MKSKKIRFSPQRETILKLILKGGGHLSVDEIYSRARAKMSRISLATVYRNLKQLEEQKQISPLQSFNQSYYEPYSAPHHHFFCTHCKEVQNLAAPTVNVCTGCITNKVPIKIERIYTTLVGLCEKCNLTEINK